MKKKGYLIAGAGIIIGIINGLLGSGGGLVAVPLINKLESNRKTAHANAVAVILPITVISAIIYLVRGDVSFNDAIIFMPTGLIGSFIGTVLLKKISNVWLKRIFGIFMVYSGIRLTLR